MYTYIHICLTYLVAWRVGESGSRRVRRGKMLHTRNHKKGNPLENATDHPLDNSSENPRDK